MHILPLLLASAVAQGEPVPTPVAGSAGPPLEGRWSGAAAREGRTWRIVLDLRRSDGGELQARFDLPDAGLYQVPAAVAVSDSIVRLRPSLRRQPEIVATLRGDTLAGSFPVGRETAPFRVVRTSGVPEAAEERELAFVSGGARLVGTLIRPRIEGSVPVVVWTHGSGLFTRDRDPNFSRAHLLARRGIASFVYDRRGRGASSGDSSAMLPFALLAGDARAAIAAVRAAAGIDSDRVAVAGLSQGTWYLPALAAEDSRIRAVVGLGTAGVTPGEQDLWLFERRLEDEGLSAAAIADSLRAREAQNVAELDATLRGSAFHAYDPVPRWRRVRAPVLLLWGEEDTIVPVVESRRRILGALTEAHNHRVTALVIPQADHPLNAARPPGAPWDFPRVAEGVSDLLSGWLAERLGSGGP